MSAFVPLDAALEAIRDRRDNGGGSASYRQACDHMIEALSAMVTPPAADASKQRLFTVRYYRDETSSVRMEITVAAASPEAARERVRANMSGEIEDLTDEELESEHAGKEEITGGEFAGLEDASDPYAVLEVKK